MKGKRVYIDTNIYAYIALKHPDFYKECYNILYMLISKEFIGYGSHLVLFELFGALSKVNVDAAYEAIDACLNLPLIILEIDRNTFMYAKEIGMLSNVTYDAVHAALVAQNNIDLVVTEDLEDWGKILKIWPEIERKFKAKSLTVYSPTRGIISSK